MIRYVSVLLSKARGGRVDGLAERGVTWSKCTRTRRCQSFRKSGVDQLGFLKLSNIAVLTVVLNLLVVFDRLEIRDPDQPANLLL